MFDTLSSRFDGILKRLRGKGRLSEADVDEVLAEIRTALLEADVNVRVVRQVVARIKEQTIGLELSKALSPSQQIVKIVNQELTNLLGGESLKITYASRPPTVVLMYRRSRFVPSVRVLSFKDVNVEELPKQEL